MAATTLPDELESSGWREYHRFWHISILLVFLCVLMIISVFFFYSFFGIFGPTTVHCGGVTKGRVGCCSCSCNDVWQVTCDTWHVTLDRLQVTGDRWQVTGHKSFFLIPPLSFFFSSSWQWWYYLHRSWDSVSPVCGNFSTDDFSNRNSLC